MAKGTLTLKNISVSQDIVGTSFKDHTGRGITADLEDAVFPGMIGAVETALLNLAAVQLIARSDPDNGTMTLHAAFSQHSDLLDPTNYSSSERSMSDRLGRIETFLTHVANRDILYQHSDNKVKAGKVSIAAFDSSLPVGPRMKRVQDETEVLTQLKVMRVESGVVKLGPFSAVFSVNSSNATTFDETDDARAPTMKAMYTFLTDAGLTFDYDNSTGPTGAAESDGRLKHNRKPIHDALQSVRKLSPQIYDKTTEIPTDETGLSGMASHPEAGFIAQEVEAIPDFAGYVHYTKQKIRVLNYNALFSYAVAAIQELDGKVQDQAKLIADLTKRLN